MRIAIIGVAVGLAVMIVSVCVVLGFKHAIRDKVVGFGSHIQVAEFSMLQQGTDSPIEVDDSVMNVLQHIEGVKHVQRFAMKQGILKTDSDFLGVAFKGVGPEFDSTFIHQHLLEGVVPKFSDKSSGNKILVSKVMADKLKLTCGSRIFAYFIDDSGVRTRRFTIAGIYQTNLTQYDNVMCYVDLYTAVKLNGWQEDMASGAELQVDHFDKLDEVENRVVKLVNRTTDKYGNTYSSKQ